MSCFLIGHIRGQYDFYRLQNFTTKINTQNKLRHQIKTHIIALMLLEIINFVSCARIHSKISNILPLFWRTIVERKQKISGLVWSGDNCTLLPVVVQSNETTLTLWNIRTRPKYVKLQTLFNSQMTQMNLQFRKYNNKVSRNAKMHDLAVAVCHVYQHGSSSNISASRSCVQKKFQGTFRKYSRKFNKHLKRIIIITKAKTNRLNKC